MAAHLRREFEDHPTTTSTVGVATRRNLGSPASRRVYGYAIDQFVAWYCSELRLAFNRIVVVRYRMYLESRGLAANTINQHLAIYSWKPLPSWRAAGNRHL